MVTYRKQLLEGVAFLFFFGVCSSTRVTGRVGGATVSLSDRPVPPASRAQFFLPERVRPGLLRVPTAGVGGVLSGHEPFRRDERGRARGLRAGRLRLGNARSAPLTANSHMRA